MEKRSQEEGKQYRIFNFCFVLNFTVHACKFLMLSPLLSRKEHAKKDKSQVLLMKKMGQMDVS